MCYFLLKHTVFLPGWISCATLGKNTWFFLSLLGLLCCLGCPKSCVRFQKNTRFFGLLEFVCFVGTKYPYAGFLQKHTSFNLDRFNWCYCLITYVEHRTKKKGKRENHTRRSLLDHAPCYSNWAFLLGMGVCLIGPVYAVVAGFIRPELCN